MKIELWGIGKTAFPYLETGIALYEKRLVHYNPFTITWWPDVKKQPSPLLLCAAEGELILGKLQAQDFLVLLDEHGLSFTSLQLSAWLEGELQQPHRRIIFLIGGAHGFSPKLRARANVQLSLSKLTFSHQMVRLFFAEQLYRAFSILKGESYHNE